MVVAQGAVSGLWPSCSGTQNQYISCREPSVYTMRGFSDAYIPPGISFVLRWQLTQRKRNVHVTPMILPIFYVNF